MDTYLTVQVKAPRRMHKAIREAVENQAGDSWDEQGRDGDVLTLRRHTAYSYVAEVATALDQLMAEGSEEHDLPAWPFAYDVYDEPTDEWMGSETMRVPMGPGQYWDFGADCDESGRARPSWHEIEAATKGKEDPGEKWAAVRATFGVDVYEAYAAYVPTPLPEQLTLDNPGR